MGSGPVPRCLLGLRGHAAFHCKLCAAGAEVPACSIPSPYGVRRDPKPARPSSQRSSGSIFTNRSWRVTHTYKVQGFGGKRLAWHVHSRVRTSRAEAAINSAALTTTMLHATIPRVGASRSQAFCHATAVCVCAHHGGWLRARSQDTSWASGSRGRQPYRGQPSAAVHSSPSIQLQVSRHPPQALAPQGSLHCPWGRPRLPVLFAWQGALN